MSEQIERFLARMAAHGQGQALIHDERVYTYGALLDKVAAAEDWIGREGIPPGTAVMLCGDFTPSAIALFLALCRKGCIVLPQTAAGQSRRQEYIDIGRPELFMDMAGKTDAPAIRQAGAREPQALYEELRRRGHAGIVVFSSGSSGTPKGIVHDVEPLLQKYGDGRPSRTACFLLFDHLGGINTMMHVLACGGCLVLLGDRAPDRVAAAIERHRIEVLPTSPSFLGLLLVSAAHERHDLGSLRLITYGTEPMPQVTLDRLAQALPHVKLGQTYGLSEVGVLATRSVASDSLWMRMGGAGFQTRVVDGILHVKARSSMLGYLNAPSPFVDDGWLVTNDRVEVHGDTLRILGRATEIINVGGEKVFPIEVEQVILEVAGVEEATVHGQSNPLMGQAVWAKVKTHPSIDAKALRTEILRHCHARLERFKVPVGITMTTEALHGQRFKKERTSVAGEAS